MANTPAVRASKTEDEKTDDLIDAIDPVEKQRKQRVIAGEDSAFYGFDRTYTQQKLMFLPKLEFVRIVTKAINRALKENKDTPLSELLGGTNADEVTSDATGDTFVRVLFQLAEFSPDLINDVYALALGVPKRDREMVIQILEEPESVIEDKDGNEVIAGGLSDEDGFEILRTFLGQNVAAMRDFYLKELPKIWTQAQKLLENPSPVEGSSKPSKRSARSTQ